MVLTPRATDLLRVIETQYRNFGYCDLASLTRALPHDPAWIRADLRTLRQAGFITGTRQTGYRPRRSTE